MASVFQDYSCDVSIIGGFGHVGLPLGILLADAGNQVALYDIDQSKRASIEAGVMPFIEYGAEPILARVIGKSLRIADSLSEAAKARVIIITVGTPVDEYMNPKLRPIHQLAEDLLPYLQPGQCVILRSTLFPGTSSYLNDFFVRNQIEVHLAYCPERIVQGHAIQELPKLTQVISGFSEPALAFSKELFKSLGVETTTVSVQEAELVKLFSNAWRYIQFSIANQFYMIATAHGADYERIYHAMTYGYKRAGDFPSPGFTAGPCLLKDTLQLTAFYGNQFQLGHAAMMVNEGLPNFIVNHLISTEGLNLNGVRVGILGMAFKADIDDTRDSLSFKLAKILKFRGAHVVCSDEYVKGDSFVTREELVNTCPIVIIGAPHSAYRELLVPRETYLLDLWGIICSSVDDSK